jgi:hypothetical protein
MGACNCGGNCNDCKKIKAKTIAENFCDPHFTGNIKYDGTELVCTNNTDINVTQGRSLNDILLGFATQLCQQSAPVYQTNSTVVLNTVNAAATDVLLIITVEEAGIYRIDFGVNVNPLATAKWNSFITLNVASPDYSISGNNSFGENKAASACQSNGSNCIIGVSLAVGNTVTLNLTATTANVDVISSMLAITKQR